MIKATELQPATLPKMKLPQKIFLRDPTHFPGTPIIPREIFQCQHLMIFILSKYMYFIVTLTFLDYLFSQDLMVHIICAHAALTHVSIPCFDEFFKHFKCFFRFNINWKKIPNFWSERSKTFWAKFIIIWSGHNEIILVLS